MVREPKRGDGGLKVLRVVVEGNGRGRMRAETKRSFREGVGL